MKKTLLFSILFAFSAMLFAQTNTWMGAGTNTNWNTVANWSLNAVPTAANDVVIPTGSTVNINVSSFVKSIVVQGTSSLTMNQSLSFTNASSFSANTTVTWNNSSLYGGGTLTNNGTVNLTTNGSSYISGATTVINNGLFAMFAGYLYLYDTAIFNNTSSGVFDFKSDRPIYRSGSAHNFNNAGLIKKTGGDGNSDIKCHLTNTGTISVESGTIGMSAEAKTFDGGIYNVATGSQLVLGTQINVSNTLTGVLDGAMNWANNVSVATTATFNFTGVTGVNWTAGSLIGDGTLTNASTINLTTNGSKYISGTATTLANTGLVAMLDGYFYLYDTAIFNNTSSGVFDFQSNRPIFRSGSDHNFNNAGLIKKTGGDGNSDIQCHLTNTGTISVENGTIGMSADAKTFDGGIYNVATGSQLVLGTQINVSNTLSGVLDGAMNWVNNVSVATTATFNFTGVTGVNWTAGSLIGGGTLTNASTINLTTNGSKYISLSTTLANTGLVTMLDGYFYLYDTAIFNNTSSGVFDFQSNRPIFRSGSDHNFNNAGLIKKTGGDGNADIQCHLTNTGTISVESGTIGMSADAKTFDGGIYNVDTDSQLILGTTINVSGTLTGVLDGAMNWANNVSVAATATFDFTGDTGINWTANSLIGGGTLTNASTINLTTNGSKYISGTATTLANTGLVNMLGGYFYLYDNTTFNNQAAGVIDFQSDRTINSRGGGFIITNEGLIKKTGGTGASSIYSPVTNSGIIDAQSGTLSFIDSYGLTNTVDGIIKGTATVDLPADANFTNDGAFAPGGSPGTLTVSGTYKSSATSGLDVELNGLTQGTEYDLLAITGTDAVFDGDVNVTMGFDAAIGDSFTIATVSGTIATKNLTTPVFGDYGCYHYTFDVSYPGDNSVMLTISNAKDIEPPTVITQNITVQLAASGNVSITTGDIDNGSSDNCIIDTMSLDITDFTCANLGDNTVSLTVTDEAGNSASTDATVTVEDSISPTAVTQNVTVQLDASGTASIAASAVDNGSSDNCSVASMSLDITSFDCSDLGANTVILTVTDGSNNSSTATATVTVVDSINPTVTCGGNSTIDSNGNYTLPNYTTNGVASAIDNCSVTLAQTPAPGTSLADGVHVISFVATDGSGNTAKCSFSLTVNDLSLGVNDFELTDDSIQLYPNPVINTLTIKNTKQLELLHAQIMDVTGKTISTFNIRDMGLTTEISLEHYASGMYFLKISGLNGALTKRIIKK